MRTSSADLLTLLQVDGRLRHVQFGLFTLSNSLNTVATLHHVRSPIVAIITLGLITAGGLTIYDRGPSPYPMGRSLAVALIVISTAFASWNLPSHGWPGWASWFWASSTILLTLLALRGRVVMAWSAFMLNASITVGWAVSSGRPLLEGVGFVIRHAGLLAIVTLFAWLLGRTIASVQHFRLTAIERAAAEGHARALLDAGDARLRQLHLLAGGTLELLASDAALTETDKAECLFREATIRDWLRGGSLATDATLEMIRTARARGVHVMLLDDASDDDPALPQASEIESQIRTVLESMDGGQVTIRRVPDGRETCVTIRAHDHERVIRVDIPTVPEQDQG